MLVEEIPIHSRGIVRLGYSLEVQRQRTQRGITGKFFLPFYIKHDCSNFCTKYDSFLNEKLFVKEKEEEATRI